jgi:biotin carboxyl carrier protein
VTVNGEPLQVEIPDMDAPLEEMDWIVVDDRPYEITFDRDLRWIKAYNAIHRVEVRDQEMMVARPHSGDGRVKAPIPGLIARVLVAAGQQVQAGDPLLVLEAMKMENEIRAQRAGVVNALHVNPGQSVARHEVLVEIS